MHGNPVRMQVTALHAVWSLFAVANTVLLQTLQLPGNCDVAQERISAFRDEGPTMTAKAQLALICAIAAQNLAHCPQPRKLS
jgi:hypothetical protein